MKQINIVNFNFKPLKKKKENTKKSKMYSSILSNNSKIELLKNKNRYLNLNNNNKRNRMKLIMPDYSFINNNINIKKYLESTPDSYDYDDAIEEDKRTFIQYYWEKIINKQIIINAFFVEEFIKPKPIKIAIFILTIDLYFLINGLFYSDSYISEIYNSTEEETMFSFVTRSIDRFVYITIVSNIIEYFIKFSFVEEIVIKNILLKNKDNSLILRYEITEIIKSIIKKIKIIIIIDYFIIIFSWYYLSCFNNVYPIINKEMIISSIFILLFMQILPFLIVFLETSIRFTSIRYESEKLYKLSLLLS